VSTYRDPERRRRRCRRRMAVIRAYYTNRAGRSARTGGSEKNARREYEGELEFMAARICTEDTGQRAVIRAKGRQARPDGDGL
jgi:hypothetical protein